jgi:hypothetical protein
MTWFGHCITNVTSALKALPTAGQLMLIGDLRDFLDRQEQEIRRHNTKQKRRRLKAGPLKLDARQASARADPRIVPKC